MIKVYWGSRLKIMYWDHVFTVFGFSFVWRRDFVHLDLSLAFRSLKFSWERR